MLCIVRTWVSVPLVREYCAVTSRNCPGSVGPPVRSDRRRDQSPCHSPSEVRGSSSSSWPRTGRARIRGNATWGRCASGGFNFLRPPRQFAFARRDIPITDAHHHPQRVLPRPRAPRHPHGQLQPRDWPPRTPRPPVVMIGRERTQINDHVTEWRRESCRLPCR